MRNLQHDHRDSTSTALSWLSISLIVAGIVLRLWQYFGRSDQWTDEATDARYIYYGAVPAYEFYESRDAGAAHAMLGSCHRGDTRGYLTELDQLRGRARAWNLFAHELPRLHEREAMLRYLDEIGRARDSMAA